MPGKPRTEIFIACAFLALQRVHRTAYWDLKASGRSESKILPPLSLATWRYMHGLRMFDESMLRSMTTPRARTEYRAITFIYNHFILDVTPLISTLVKEGL